MEKKLDFTAAWKDAIALLKANLETILPIAGVFFLLPMIVLGYAVPQPEIVPGASGDAATAQMSEFLATFFPALLIVSLISMFGSLAIYAMVLKPERPSVGQALTLALAMFIPLFLAQILSGLATIVGFIFLIAPGIYLAIKFSLTGPALVAEDIKNPIAALSRSWQLTKGNSLYIFAFFLIIGLVGVIVMLVTSGILSTIFGMILPETIGTLVSAIISGILQAIFSIVMMFVSIAIYRQLSASN